MGDELSSKRLKRWGLAGTFAALSGVLIWSGADLLIDRTISRFSPEIEKKLSNSLGHPLKIGSYKGLRLWGIELGPTRILPSVKDSSSINISISEDFAFPLFKKKLQCCSDSLAPPTLRLEQSDSLINSQAFLFPGFLNVLPQVLMLLG